MAQLLALVLDNLEQCPAVLDAWEAAGVGGVTILESSGLGRLRGIVRDDLPLIPSLRDLFATREFQHRTLFTVVEDEETLERVIAATEKVVGDLDEPHTGLLFVVPVSRVLGLHKRRANR
ncbi:MAG: P-II family nitrogen regulator [Anaerolineae bacterium]|jgi:nitrogen regulatory protein PII|nr:P-II family nitrogen regulator [Anaerolineae bacterium]